MRLMLLANTCLADKEGISKSDCYRSARDSQTLTRLRQPRISHIFNVTYTRQMNSLEKLNVHEKLEQVFDQNTWMEREVLARVVKRVSTENASVASRCSKISAIADRFNAALAPVAACRAGCAHCCHMPTMIYAHEAARLAAASGRSPADLRPRRFEKSVESAKAFLGLPCPFLQDDQCVVYEARPLICRLHHSLNDDPSDCRVNVPLAQRIPIASFDVDIIELPYHEIMSQRHPAEAWASIHEFFPA